MIGRPLRSTGHVAPRRGGRRRRRSEDAGVEPHEPSDGQAQREPGGRARGRRSTTSPWRRTSLASCSTRSGRLYRRGSLTGLPAQAKTRVACRRRSTTGRGTALGGPVGRNGRESPLTRPVVKRAASVSPHRADRLLLESMRLASTRCCSSHSLTMACRPERSVWPGSNSRPGARPGSLPGPHLRSLPDISSKSTNPCCNGSSSSHRLVHEAGAMSLAVLP